VSKHQGSSLDEEERSAEMASTAEITKQAEALAREWATNPRWKGIERSYTAEDVVRLRGSVQEEHTLARPRRGSGCGRSSTPRTTSTRLGALTGNQAVQTGARRPSSDLPVRLAGSRATPTSARRPTPTRASTPPTRLPAVVRRINNALKRADQITWSEGGSTEQHIDWFRADRRGTPRPASAAC